MKKLCLAAGLLTCVVGSPAFAQSPVRFAQEQAWKPPLSTLTRAQVQRSLIHAEQDGQFKYLDTVLYRGSR
jgi:hypothetical protein